MKERGQGIKSKPLNNFFVELRDVYTPNCNNAVIEKLKTVSRKKAQ